MEDPDHSLKILKILVNLNSLHKLGLIQFKMKTSSLNLIKEEVSNESIRKILIFLPIRNFYFINNLINALLILFRESGR